MMGIKISQKKIFFCIVFCFGCIALAFFAFIKDEEFVVVNQFNDAQLSDQWNKTEVQDDGKFHLVMNFMLVSKL